MQRVALRTAVVIASLVSAAHAPTAGAQADLARRIVAAAAAGGGTARISFAAREGVCGDGATMVAEALGPNEFAIYNFQGSLNGTFTELSGNWNTTDSDIASRCRPGPVHATLDVRGRTVTAARATVSGTRRPGVAGDVGMVSAAEASRYFLDLARTADETLGRTALLLANLADSTNLSPALIGLARDRALRTWTREGALRWLGRIADRGDGTPEADVAVRAIAADEDDEAAVRERAVRSLRAGTANDAFLRSLYAKAGAMSLRERIVRQVGESRTDANARWLEDLAVRATEPTALRERAVRVLGEEQGRHDRLRGIYARTDDATIRERILRVVAERGGADAMRWLREVAEDRASSTALRERAIRLLGEAGEHSYLRALYPRLEHATLRDRVLRVAAEGGADGMRLVREVAMRADEPAPVRDRAVRLIAERGADGAELARLYDAIVETSVRSRLVSLMAEQGDRAALDKLRAVARSDPDPELRQRALRRLAERS